MGTPMHLYLERLQKHEEAVRAGLPEGVDQSKVLEDIREDVNRLLCQAVAQIRSAEPDADMEEILDFLEFADGVPAALKVADELEIPQGVVREALKSFAYEVSAIWIQSRLDTERDNKASAASRSGSMAVGYIGDDFEYDEDPYLGEDPWTEDSESY